MAAVYHHHYHETEEAREARDFYNEASMGVKGEDSVAPRVELPTAAGSVLLDLGKLSEGSSALGIGAAPRAIERATALRSQTKRSGPLRNSKQLVQEGALWRKGVRGRRGSSSEWVENEGSPSPTVGGGRSRGLQLQQPDMPAHASLFNKGVEAEDVPPLTAEDAKARATRTAMLVEYAYRHEYAKRGSEMKFNVVLSA